MAIISVIIFVDLNVFCITVQTLSLIYNLLLLFQDWESGVTWIAGLNNFSNVKQSIHII